MKMSVSVSPRAQMHVSTCGEGSGVSGGKWGLAGGGKGQGEGRVGVKESGVRARGAPSSAAC